MDDCKHGLDASTCTTCKNPGHVYVSEGWRATTYHSTSKCRSLIKGQGTQDNPAPVVRIQLADAIAEKVRRPCATCYPEKYPRQISR